MERRYYLLKIAAIVVAIATAAFTSGVGNTRMAHAIDHARYTAPAQVEAAAWHTTAYLSRGVAHLVGLCSILRP